MKTKSEISAYILRGAAAALLFSCVIVVLSSAINTPGRHPLVPAPTNDAGSGVNATYTDAEACTDTAAAHHPGTTTLAEEWGVVSEE